MLAADVERPDGRRPGATTRHLVSVALTLGILAFLVLLVRGDVTAAAHQLGHVRWAWVVVAGAAGIASLVCFAGVRLVLLRVAGGRMAAEEMIG